MPKRKRSFKRSLVRRKRRRALFRGRRYRIARLPLTGFPANKLVRLRYASEFKLDATSAATAFHVWRLNSCYDPNLTGIGIQPTGFDEWMNVYNHCTVLGAKLIVRCLGPDGSANVTPSMWGIVIDSSSTAVNSTTTAQEVMMLPGNAIALGGAVNMGAQYKNVLSKKWSAKKFFGRNVRGAADYRHDASSNPNEGAYATVFTTNIDNTEPGELHFFLTIDYIALFSEKRKLSMS